MQKNASFRQIVRERHGPASNSRMDMWTSFAASCAIHGAVAVCAGTVIALQPAHMVPAFRQGDSAVALTLVLSEPQPEPTPEPEIVPVVLSEPDSGIQIEQARPEAPKEPEPEKAPEDADALTKGVQSEAQLQAEIRPAYPLGSRMRGEEGTVTIRAVVDADGKAVTITVVESSGFAALDNAAVNSLRKTTFVPTQKDGLSVEGETTVRIRFRLVD